MRIFCLLIVNNRLSSMFSCQNAVDITNNGLQSGMYYALMRVSYK